LGGSKNGKLTAIRNTFIIFLVSGFWHGANWNFIFWGGLHACGFLPLLLLNRNRKHVNEVVAADRKLPNLKELWQMLTTFVFVTFAWIFFRIHSLSGAIDYIKRIFTDMFANPGQFARIPDDIKVFYYIIPLVVMDWYIRRDERKLRNFGWVVNVILGVLIWAFFKKESSFIYFQF
jgi:D-alanyl-lipoteichoic acid acyltransferase DltB (MBOAT superfamily)